MWEKEWSSNFSLDLTLLGCDSFTIKSLLEVERMIELCAKLFHFHFHQGTGLIFRFISLLSDTSSGQPGLEITCQKNLSNEETAGAAVATEALKRTCRA